MRYHGALVDAMLLAVVCCAAPCRSDASDGQTLDVSITTTTDQLDAAAAILRRHITNRSTTTTCGFNATSAAIHIQLAIAPSVGAEAYIIRDTPEPSGSVLVSGGDVRGVLFGVGALLRNASFGATFALGSARGGGAPALANGFRAMYLATHLGNFYVSAPVEAVKEVMEDLSLWGANTVILAFPWQDFTGFDDPNLKALMDKQASLYRAAQSVGLAVGIISSNQGMQSRPDNISACTDYHTKLDHFQGADFAYRVSTAKPGGMAHLVENNKRFFAEWKKRGVSLDFLVMWPYDNGGSGKCRRPARPRTVVFSGPNLSVGAAGCQGLALREWPWGSFGHANLSAAITRVGKQVFPKLRTVVSMWGFDLNNAQATADFGEYAGMDAFIKANPGVFDFTMTDSGLSYPEWPIKNGRGPGGLPLLNFPEISMHYREPWGGTGANPMPTRFQSLWEPVKGIVSGGMPYSEGIFEDINQVICFQHYWNGSTTANQIVREYVASQFGKEDGVVEAVTQAIALMEQATPMGHKNVSASFPGYPSGPDGQCYNYK